MCSVVVVVTAPRPVRSTSIPSSVTSARRAPAPRRCPGSSLERRPRGAAMGASRPVARQWHVESGWRWDRKDHDQDIDCILLGVARASAQPGSPRGLDLHHHPRHRRDVHRHLCRCPHARHHFAPPHYLYPFYRFHTSTRHRHRSPPTYVIRTVMADPRATPFAISMAEQAAASDVSSRRMCSAALPPDRHAAL